MRHLTIFGVVGPLLFSRILGLLYGFPSQWMLWIFWFALPSFLFAGAIDRWLSKSVSTWERVIVSGFVGFCATLVPSMTLMGPSFVSFAAIAPSMFCSLVSTASKPKDGMTPDEEAAQRR